MNQDIRESGVMDTSIQEGVCTRLISNTNFCITVSKTINKIVGPLFSHNPHLYKVIRKQVSNDNHSRVRNISITHLLKLMPVRLCIYM